MLSSFPFLSAAQKLNNNNDTSSYRGEATLLVSEDWYGKARIENEKGNYQRTEECLLRATEVDDEKSEISNTSQKTKSKGKLRIEAADNLVHGPIMELHTLKLVKTQYGFSVKENNPLVAIKICSGQVRWVSPIPIGGWHVKEVVVHLKKYNQSVHINTGGHGKPDGTMVRDNPLLADVNFIKEDMKLIWNLENVSLHIMSSYSGPIYPDKANHVIDAWCYSKKTMEKNRKKLNNQARKKWFCAAEKGETEKIETIINSYKFDVNLKDTDGYTALHKASEKGYLCSVEALLKAGANKNIKTYWFGIGSTPIDLARGKNQKRAVKLLQGKQLTKDDLKEEWLFAALKGQLAIAKVLKKRGANIHAKDKNGKNALHWACYSGLSVEMVTWLLDVCKLDIESKGEYQYTPFLYAAVKGRLAIAKLLRQRGANIYAKSEYGNNALHFACWYSGSVEMVTWLVDVCKMDIETKGQYEKTPFLFAAQKGQLAIAKLLRQRGANIYAKSEGENNALHFACWYSGSVEMVTWLLDVCHIPIESKGYYKKTPFLCAAENGHLGIAKRLKEQGANIYAKDWNGDNALWNAKWLSNSEAMINYLKELGLQKW